MNNIIKYISFFILTFAIIALGINSIINYQSYKELKVIITRKDTKKEENIGKNDIEKINIDIKKTNEKIESLEKIIAEQKETIETQKQTMEQLQSKTNNYSSYQEQINNISNRTASLEKFKKNYGELVVKNGSLFASSSYQQCIYRYSIDDYNSSNVPEFCRIK